MFNDFQFFYLLNNFICRRLRLLTIESDVNAMNKFVNIWETIIWIM